MSLCHTETLLVWRAHNYLSMFFLRPPADHPLYDQHHDYRIPLRAYPYLR